MILISQSLLPGVVVVLRAQIRRRIQEMREQQLDELSFRSRRPRAQLLDFLGDAIDQADAVERYMEWAS